MLDPCIRKWVGRTDRMAVPSLHMVRKNAPDIPGKQSSAATITGPREVRLRDELTDSATFQVIVAPLDGTSGT